MEGNVLPEGQIVLLSIFTWGFPFFGYYAGMVFRHFAFTHDRSPTFYQRLAIEVPASLMLVSSFLALLSEIGDPSVVSTLFVTGFVMEQGFLLELALVAYVNAHNHRKNGK